MLSDAVSMVSVALLAFVLRFEGTQWILEQPAIVASYIALTIPVKLAVFYKLGLYRRLWRHASIGELQGLVIATSAGALVSAVVGFFIVPLSVGLGGRVPISVVFMDAMMSAAVIGLPRLLARVRGRSRRRRRRDDVGRPTLIVGAGDTGKLVAKELYVKESLGLDPVGFVDDDPRKHNQILCDLPVIGPVSRIREYVETLNVAEIIIAMPTAPGNVIRAIVRQALDSGVAIRTVPSLQELIWENGARPTLREVEIQDLLRREPVETDLAAVAELATQATVLVTGAGGSIGSELCRQVARLAPARLVLVGHGENSIFDVWEELRSRYPEIRFDPVIADVRDRSRMHEVMQRFRPHAVFHTAAHKHVPLMEHNSGEAITNNVLGTRVMVEAAVQAGVSHFVLISTDKAVRPSSIMGATKRVAEQIVQYAAAKHDRNFVSVRFGNVLGSRGSVVPTFLRQIRNGGPVTITHPEMQRYFMTIPEAVQLVLQAGALGHGGEVFVLDMGQPVRVLDLAHDLIRLSGLDPGRDIKIEFTGIRPGEKLYEEMFFSAERVLPTSHPKVLRAKNGMPAEGTMKRIETLIHLAERGGTETEIRGLLQSMVPDFHPHPSAMSSVVQPPRLELEHTSATA
jgi:FlaA1/EpsC-like NDP-sugar epimerase